MPSDTGSEPAGWGTSSGRFGAGDQADAGSTGSSGRRASGRQGSSRSSPWGSREAGGGQRKPRSGRRGGSARASFDDPFGPVVGASADASDTSASTAEGPPSDDAAADAGRSGGRRSAQRSTRRGERRRGDTPESADGVPDESPEPDRSEEEWASEGRAILLRQLTLGPRSRHQLGRKLAERDVPPRVAAALLDRFEEVQLIDDAEFARMWVRTRTAMKALSRSSIRRELADKGIDPDLAEDALLQISDEDEHDQAHEVVRRKLRRSADLSDRGIRDKELRRLVGVLARKGYSPGTAFTIVKDVLAEVESPE